MYIIKIFERREHLKKKIILFYEKWNFISKSIDVIATDLYLKVTNSCYPNRDFT